MVVAGLAAGCATLPPPAPVFVVSPGTGRDQGIFQQDSEICQQHATAGSGYGTPSKPPDSATPATSGTWIASANAPFLQCMAARGDVVAAAPADYAAAYPGFDYGYAYPFGYFDPYPIYFGGLAGGFAYGGWRYRGWGYGGWGHGGWARGGWGHGGWGHGGWGHGGAASGGHGGGHH
jgi:hypothetical protein